MGALSLSNPLHGSTPSSIFTYGCESVYWMIIITITTVSRVCCRATRRDMRRAIVFIIRNRLVSKNKKKYQFFFNTTRYNIGSNIGSRIDIDVRVRYRISVKLCRPAQINCDSMGIVSATTERY